MELGILTLLPPVLIIITALITKKTTSSLLIGVLLCYSLKYGTDLLDPFIDLIYRVGTSADTIWIIVFTSLFGCFIQLIIVSGGEKAFITMLKKYATTQKKTMVLSWLAAGLVVFFDDFTSILIRGMMTKLYDDQKIPRAMLTYIADATASPLCILIPFGTWAVFYQSLFSGYEEVTSIGPVMTVYMEAIPFMFYGWAALLVSLLASLNILKPIGAMKKAYIRAAATGKLYGPESETLNMEEEPGINEMTKEQFVKGIFCFLIPIFVLIITALITLDVLKAVIITIAIQIPLYLIVGRISWKEMMHASMKGIESMTSMIVIVFVAYMLKEAITDIGLPEYVISIVSPVMSNALMPVITFLACVVLTFTTGSNWGGTVGITAIVIPLAGIMGTYIPLVLAAIVSGAAFGAHVCFYTDVTVFTSVMTKIDNQEHAITQLPYGIIGMAISTAAYLISGYILA